MTITTCGLDLAVGYRDMDLLDRCRSAVEKANLLGDWQLPAEAQEDLARSLLPYVDETAEPELIDRVVQHYFHDGPQVEALSDSSSRTADAYWERVRLRYLHICRASKVAPIDCEDVAHDALHRAQKHLSSYAFRGPLDAWLERIIRNTCARWHDQQGRNQWQSLDEPADDDLPPLEKLPSAGTPDPEDSVLRAERRSLLEATLAQLLSQRDLLILRYSYLETHYVDEVTLQPKRWKDADIAQKVGLAPSSIPTLRKRAQQRLAANKDFVRLVGNLFGEDWATAAAALSD